MLQTLLGFTRKELSQALRDPRMRGMLILPPLIQLLIFGYAVNLDVDNAKIAWMDQDRTPESRQLLSEFEGSGRFQIVAAPDSDAAMQRLMEGTFTLDDFLDQMQAIKKMGPLSGLMAMMPGSSKLLYAAGI